MNINFNMERHEWENFKLKVGEGNASKLLRDFVRSYINDNGDDDELKRLQLLKKQISLLEPDYQKINAEHEKIKAEIQVIENKKKVEEMKRNIEAEKQAENFRRMQHELAKEEIRRAALGR